MRISSRCITNMLFFVGFITLSKGRTSRPNPTQKDKSNSISSTSPIFPTTSSPTVTISNGKSITNPAIMAQNKKEGNTAKNNTTIPAAKSHDNPDKGGLPLWGYILISIGSVIVVLIVSIIIYAKVVKWKDHGTYMVWDDAELETSPAFTRESEFLLETQTGIQENTPELQLYEIPLDSVNSQPRLSYMGTKRVAPKKQEEKRRSSKDYRKKDGESHAPSLTKYTKRNTMYNSVTDTCITSVMSEGTLDGHDSTSSHTLATVMFSNGGLDKYASSTQFNSIDPKQDKSQSIGNRVRSVSNLIQSRPLPAVPINKRFSKSLDKFRFFNTLPVISTKNSTPKAGLLLGEPYTNLVKSASYGSNLHRNVNNNLCLPIVDDQPALFATRKSSLDINTGVAVDKLHRKSKSLDTLTLLKGIDMNITNVDVHHSYESVHNGELEHLSVSDNQPYSPTMSEYTPQNSPTKLSNATNTSPSERDVIYASLSHEDLQRKISQETEGNNTAYDSSTLSSLSSNAPSPYASVRISQIPGLSYDHCEHQDIYIKKAEENSGESFETTTPENSGSSGVELKPTTNSARSSTHTYVELFPPQTGRESVISETSSGYARPVDIMDDVLKTSNKDDKPERNSLTDIKIPIEDKVVFDKTDMNSEVYDNPVNVTDDGTDDCCHQRIQDGINLDTSIDAVHVNIRPLLKRNNSEHSDYEI